MSNNYFYLVEEKATKMYELPKNCSELNVLCYYVNTQIIEPFLLFAMKKDNVTNSLNFFKILNNSTNVINSTNETNNYKIEENVDELMHDIGFNNYLYHGIICDNFDNYFVAIEIKNNEYNNKNNINFLLTTEIINNKTFLNILINEKVVDIFTNTPMFGILMNKFNNNIKLYKLPDVAYKYINKCNKNYYLLFGNEKEKLFENCDEYYFFNREYLSKYNNLGEICCIRYAIFNDNKIYFENNDLFSLTDCEIDEILSTCKYKTLLISYLNNNAEQNADLLVVNYNCFISLL